VSRVAMVEAVAMLRSGSDMSPAQVAFFLSNAIEATALRGDALPVAG